MARVLILTAAPGAEVLPALSLLSHETRQIPADPASLISAPASEIIVVDATRDLVTAKSLCAVLGTTGNSAPLLLVTTEGGMAAVTPQWGVDDVLLQDAGPAEIDARIRLALGTREAEPSRTEVQGITIDEANYSAKAQGRALDLTFTEFELLRFLVRHPARVFTREQLLSEVWGYDYYGGTRTVDVHVRRLRAKLGDLESLIGTVRGVGYRFTVMEDDGERLAPPVAG